MLAHVLYRVTHAPYRLAHVLYRVTHAPYRLNTCTLQGYTCTLQANTCTLQANICAKISCSKLCDPMPREREIERERESVKFGLVGWLG